MSIGVQVVFRAEHDRVLAPHPAARRAWALALLEFGRKYGLYGFGLADSHGHAVLFCASVSGFVHDLRVALSSRLGLPMVAPSLRPIRDTWHAESVLGYVHRQDLHHGVGADKFREGTSLPDLLGLRPRGAWLADRVRTHLPRVCRADLLGHWGLGALQPAFDLALLREAGAAAVAVCDLAGRSSEVVVARRACVHAAGAARTRELAAALGISERAVRRLRAEEADERLVRAVLLQMGLRRAITPRRETTFVADVASPWGGETLVIA